MPQNDNYEDFINSNDYEKLLELLQNGTEDEVDVLLGLQHSDIVPISSPKTPKNNNQPVIDKPTYEEPVQKLETNNNYSLGVDGVKMTKMIKRNEKNRCGKCNSRLKLFDFTCKCKIKFCSTHKHPEEHYCDFNHKKKAREILKSNNPVVVTSKVPII